MEHDEEYEIDRLINLTEFLTLDDIISQYSDYEPWEVVRWLIQTGIIRSDIKTAIQELSF